MKKSSKLVTMLCTLSFILTTGSVVLAEGEDGKKSKIPTIGNGPPTGSGLANLANNVLGYVQFFGYALAIGMLLYIGIKYMMASANEKADLKKGSINYVIGAVLVAGATFIVSIFVSIGGSITQ